MESKLWTYTYQYYSKAQLGLYIYKQEMEKQGFDLWDILLFWRSIFQLQKIRKFNDYFFDCPTISIKKTQ